jgi:hypothetical protein
VFLQEVTRLVDGQLRQLVAGGVFFSILHYGSFELILSSS